MLRSRSACWVDQECRRRPREAGDWAAVHRQLQDVVLARRIGHELRHVAEARLGWFAVHGRREAPVADGLVAVDVHD